MGLSIVLSPYFAAARPQARRSSTVGRVDKQEARRILNEEISKLRQRGYADLRESLLRESETFEVVGASGTRYQVEIEAVWDSGRDGPLRVFVLIDDGGWRSFAFRPFRRFSFAPGISLAMPVRGWLASSKTQARKGVSGWCVSRALAGTPRHWRQLAPTNAGAGELQPPRLHDRCGATGDADG